MSRTVSNNAVIRIDELLQVMIRRAILGREVFHLSTHYMREGAPIELDRYLMGVSEGV